ncbi:MAG: serpin family protein [Candidatus Diapherotrites archaeon]|nr:serpin family protein [Candidatus Diapherotrites archaeon]
MVLDRIKQYLKPTASKGVLTLLLFLLAFLLAFVMLLIGIPIPHGLLVLKVLGLPVVLVSLFGSSVSPILIVVSLILTILWLYLVSCVLVYVGKWIVSIRWTPRRVAVLGAVVMLGLVLYGFSALGFGDIFIPAADDSGATPEGVASVVKANNQFAVNLYSEIIKDPRNKDKNVFFSPWSISSAMVMAYEGARGQTADEIHSVFYFPEDDKVRRSSFARMLNTINKGGGKYELHTANALWLQKDYPFLESYKNVVSRHYLGEVRNLDFVHNPYGSSQEINNWVAGHTNNKIQDIVSPDLFETEDIRAVITNAMYFKGKWAHQFDKADTRMDDFTLESGEKVEVPMMSVDDDFNYAEADGIQILEMDYQGGKISMLVLLPLKENMYSMHRRVGDTSFNISYLESILTEEKLQEWRGKLRKRELLVYIPKYTFETSYSLVDYLKSMGMKKPFSLSGADFSGMDGTKGLYLRDVLHKAYVKVDEEGTEAAAATAVLVAMVAVPEKFRADHPFIFIIQEKSTGNILFMGKVMDPTKLKT